MPLPADWEFAIEDAEVLSFFNNYLIRSDN
jgi:hypothetical protein